MSSDDWYRGENWDSEAQTVFEAKLKRSRGDYNKAQYLQIKASYLIKSNDKTNQESGVILLKRLIDDYPTQLSSVKFAYELLGDYYASKNDFERAEINYRNCIQFYGQGRSGTSGIVDIKLGEIIVSTKQSSKYHEMHSLLTNQFERTQGQLLLNDEIFRYYSVLAKISDGLGKKGEARTFASQALQVAEITKPQLNTHTQLGLVNASEKEKNALKSIVGK